jgi:hypothetical protein
VEFSPLNYSHFVGFNCTRAFITGTSDHVKSQYWYLSSSNKKKKKSVARCIFGDHLKFGCHRMDHVWQLLLSFAIWVWWSQVVSICATLSDEGSSVQLVLFYLQAEFCAAFWSLSNLWGKATRSWSVLILGWFALRWSKSIDSSRRTHKMCAFRLLIDTGNELKDTCNMFQCQLNEMFIPNCHTVSRLHHLQCRYWNFIHCVSHLINSLVSHKTFPFYQFFPYIWCALHHLQSIESHFHTLYLTLG